MDKFDTESNKIHFYLKLLQMMHYSEKMNKDPYIEATTPQFDPTEPEYYCSKGLQNLKEVNGFNTMLGYMTDLTDAPVVSVGSGSGYVEAQCLERIPGLQIVLVDPVDPEENTFSPVPEHLSKKPSYCYVEDLVADNPDIVGECHLFLNWSLPNNDFYDYESILALKPLSIIICCEVSGSAGSKKLLAWLDYCGVKCRDLFTHTTAEEMNITGPDYLIDESISVDSKCSLGWPTRFMLIKLSRK